MLNHLRDETSPYLLQHAHNPVEWYPWCQDAFSRAKSENKPIHLSIGYASCHWCHRMAQECFENPEIAKKLNDDFINIKIDRQERPDIDETYQKVLHMLGQGGGWPLTIFMNSNGEPFFGGTYFPADDSYGKVGFKKILNSLNEAWKKNHPDIQHNIQHFIDGFHQCDKLLNSTEPVNYDDLPQHAAGTIAQNTSSTHGGLTSSPKFPNVCNYDLVLRVFHRTRDAKLFGVLEKTLDGMACGGIFDQIGGGFSRYSITEDWSIPHFEKMLCDNGQLVKLYADAYRMTGKLPWKRVFEETIEYVLRDMTHPAGGFFAAEDADSEKQEGSYYLWTPHQVFEIFGKTHGDFVCRGLGITAEGNFSNGRSVPQRTFSLADNNEDELAGFRHKLLQARNLRIRPARDENIITSWNALMIEGLCAAFQATGQTQYLQAAKKAADFLITEVSLPNGEIFRIWNNGSRKIPGFLDDYAFLANALIDLYECCFEKTYLARARQLVDLILKKFWSGNLYFTPNDGEPLIHRPQSPYDIAMPSGISSTLFALLRLNKLYDSPTYRDFAEQIFNHFAAICAKQPLHFPHLLAAREFLDQDAYEIIIAGDRSSASVLMEALHRNYIPNKVLAFADDVPIGHGRIAIDHQPTAHVCRTNTCRLPVTDTTELLHQCGL